MACGLRIVFGKGEPRAVVSAYSVGPTTQSGAIWARIPRSRSARHGLMRSSAFPESSGELVLKQAIAFGELLDALVGKFEAAVQRRPGGAILGQCAVAAPGSGLADLAE